MIRHKLFVATSLIGSVVISACSDMTRSYPGSRQ